MRILLCFSLLFCLAHIAQAEELPRDGPFDHRLALPQGSEAEVNGQTMQCFSAPEYLTLIRMDTAYGALFDWRLEALGTLKAFETTIASRDQLILKQEGIIQTLKDDREWLTLRLNQSSENLVSQASQARWEKVAMWAVIIVETGLLVYQGIAD